MIILPVDTLLVGEDVPVSESRHVAVGLRNHQALNRKHYRQGSAKDYLGEEGGLLEARKRLIGVGRTHLTRIDRPVRFHGTSSLRHCCNFKISLFKE